MIKNKKMKERSILSEYVEPRPINCKVTSGLQVWNECEEFN